MERGRAGDASGEPWEVRAVVCARTHLEGIRALARNGLEQLRYAELHLLVLETDPGNSEAMGAVARTFCNFRKAARRLKLRDLHYYVMDAERPLRDALDACFIAETTIDSILNAIGVLRRYLASTEEALARGEALPPREMLPALRHGGESSGFPMRAAAAVSPHDARKRLGELLMASGDLTEGDLQVALFEYEGFEGGKRLGELLLEDVRVGREQLNRALAEQQTRPEHAFLGQILLEMGVLSSAGLKRTLEKQKRVGMRRLGGMLVRAGRVPAQRVVAALRRQSVVRDAVRYGLGSLAARLTACATKTGHPRQRNRFSADEANDLARFCDAVRGLMEVAEENLLELESEPENTVALESLRRAVQAASRFGCYLGLADIGRFGRAFSGYLAAVNQGRFRLEGPCLDVAFDCVEVLRRHVGYVEEGLTKEGRMRRERQLPEYIAFLRHLTAGSCERLRIGSLRPSEEGERLGDILISSGLVEPDVIERALAAQSEAPAMLKLGEVLVREARVSRDQTEAALAAQKKNPALGKLGNILVQWGLVDREAIEAALAEQRVRGRPRLGEVLMEIGAVPAKAIAHGLRRQRVARAGAAAALVAASILVPALPAESSERHGTSEMDVAWIMDKGQEPGAGRGELLDVVKAGLVSNVMLPETDCDGMLDGWGVWRLLNPPGAAGRDVNEGAAKGIAGGSAYVNRGVNHRVAEANGETHVTVADIQCLINAALGLDTPLPSKFSPGGALGAMDIQRVIKQALDIPTA